MGQLINPLLFEGEHLVRQIDRDDEIWFVDADVCRVLGLANPHSSLALLDEDERHLHTVEGEAGERDMILVSEAGVYRLVFRSRKPVAERFKRWLAHEVIPAIRRTGAYGRPSGVEGEVMPEMPEHRPFPDWPISELTAKNSTVGMFNRVYGPLAAQWISPQLGFPVPPIETIEHGRQGRFILVPQVAEEAEAA